MDSDRGARTASAPAERVLTAPNLLSFLRLLGVPLFVWAIATRHDLIALIILMASGITDYLDGYIARRFHLESRLGQLLDPVADRLYIVTTVVGLAWRDIIPVWFVALLIARDAFMTVVVVMAKRHGHNGLPVHFVGKAATFNLLYAFPALLLADGDGWLAQIAAPIGWGFAWWGAGLYWVAAFFYAAQLRTLLSDGTRTR